MCFSDFQRSTITSPHPGNVSIFDTIVNQTMHKQLLDVDIADSDDNEDDEYENGDDVYLINGRQTRRSDPWCKAAFRKLP